MKRIVSVILPVIFLLSLISCTDATVNSTPTPTAKSSSLSGPLDYDDETLYAFSYHLVRSGIDPELKFDDSVNSYEYENKKLKGIIEVMYADGVEVSSIVGFADNFGYRLNFWNYNKQEWSFYTNVPVKGLSLPMDITFEDDLKTALSKMDIPVDPLNSFSPDEGTENTMTLEKADTASLVFYDDTDDKENGTYSIIFTEKFEYNSLNYTKNLKLYYDLDGNLTKVNIRMNWM